MRERDKDNARREAYEINLGHKCNGLFAIANHIQLGHKSVNIVLVALIWPVLSLEVTGAYLFRVAWVPDIFGI